MGRKKKEEEKPEEEENPIKVPCRRCKTGMEKLNAEILCQCDHCFKELYGGGICAQCGHKLCGVCYEKKYEEAKEETERQQKYAKYIVPEGTIHPEIWAFCDEYSIQDKLVKQLNYEMTYHHDTWEADMAKLRMDMRNAKGNRNGLLCACLKQMRNGEFFGVHPPNPKIARVILDYKLDRDAREKMTDFLQKRERAGDDWEKDLWDIEQRIVGAANASKMALHMIVCIQRGREYPTVRPVKKDAVKEYDKRHGHNDRGRSRSRSRRRERDRSRSRDRDRGSGSHRDRDYDFDRGKGKNDDENDDDRFEREQFCKGIFNTQNIIGRCDGKGDDKLGTEGKGAEGAEGGGVEDRTGGMSVLLDSSYEGRGHGLVWNEGPDPARLRAEWQKKFTPVTNKAPANLMKGGWQIGPQGVMKQAS